MTEHPFNFSITSDGGAKNNGTADAHGYGSYHIQTQDGREALVRLDFGPGVTNNVAEYRALIEALKDLVQRIKGAGRSPADYSLVAHTDSQLLVGQVSGASPALRAAASGKVRQPHLRPLCDEARQLLARFASTSRLLKRPRAEIEAILGH